jgi:hypothetical protein
MDDPGRLPYKDLMKDAQRRAREAEAKAAMSAQLRSEARESANSARGVRQALIRLRKAISRRG